MEHGQVTMLARALARLRTGATEDAALLDALTALMLPPKATQSMARDSQVAVLRRAAIGAGPTEQQAAPLSKPVTPTTPTPDPADPAPRPRERTLSKGRLAAEPSQLQLQVERADLVIPERSPSVAAAQSPADADTAATSVPLEGLFAAGRVRGILREMTTLVSDSGATDIAAVVRRIARAEPIARLPRLRISRLGHAVLWLFDAGPSMLPFASDKQQLAANAIRLLGRDRVRIADFIGDPLQAVRAQRQVRWGRLHWPPRGSTLVVVGDLGLGAGESPLHAAAWRQFQDEATRRGLRSVLLIPYEQRRWPAAAAGFDTTLAWDLATGVQALRRRRRLAHLD